MYRINLFQSRTPPRSSGGQGQDQSSLVKFLALGTLVKELAFPFPILVFLVFLVFCLTCLTCLTRLVTPLGPLFNPRHAAPYTLPLFVDVVQTSHAALLTWVVFRVIVPARGEGNVVVRKVGVELSTEDVEQAVEFDKVG